MPLVQLYDIICITIVATSNCYDIFTAATSPLFMSLAGKAAILADVKIDHLHSLLWHSEMECMNALYMHDLIVPLMPLYRVKF